MCGLSKRDEISFILRLLSVFHSVCSGSNEKPTHIVEIVNSYDTS